MSHLRWKLVAETAVNKLIINDYRLGRKNISRHQEEENCEQEEYT